MKKKIDNNDDVDNDNDNDGVDNNDVVLNETTESSLDCDLNLEDCRDEEEIYIEAAKYGVVKHKINQSTFYNEPHLIKENEITPGILRSEYELRRKRLFHKIPKESMIILASNPECKFSLDGQYKYRQDSSFNYFTGLQEAFSLAVLTKDIVGNCKYILFVRSIIENEITWHGHRCGLKAAKLYFGANESYDFNNDHQILCDLMEKYGKIYFNQNINESITCDIKYYQKQGNKDNKNNKIRLYKSCKLISNLKLIKSESEIKLLRKSCEISSLSMIDTMQFCKPGMLENELFVQFEYGCKVRGATRLSFECSVASGKNATNLSYFNNNSILIPGELCLIDCGCEYNGYASDITRTFPINGKFNKAQSELYKMVLNVSNKLISMMIIGCTIKKLENESAKLIKDGLKELGVTSKLQKDEIKKLKISSADVHFVSHFIGLDIHDTSDISSNTPFKPNMVLAIEPAIYIPDHPLIPPKYKNIGIRIEDDVLITNNKPQILSKCLPRKVKEIEQIMNQQPKNQRIVPYTLINNDNNNNKNKNTNDTLEVGKYVCYKPFIF